MKSNILFVLLIFLQVYSCSTDHKSSTGKLREVIAFNDNWGFTPDSLQVGINQKWQNRLLPDSKIINIPHTWNTQKNIGEYYGPAWYQKIFRIPWISLIKFRLLDYIYSPTAPGQARQVFLFLIGLLRK